MPTLTIRQLPESVRDRLRLRAAKRGHSMEAEARAILAADLLPGRRSLSNGSAADLQAWVAAKHRSRKAKLSNVDELLRDRRREALMEILRDGLDPAEALGPEFARVIEEAGWTATDLQKLRQKLSPAR